MHERAVKMKKSDTKYILCILVYQHQESVSMHLPSVPLCYYHRADRTLFSTECLFSNRSSMRNVFLHRSSHFVNALVYSAEILFTFL